MTEPSPRRVRVTHPRMAAARRATSRPVTREIDEQTGVGEVYLRSLIRSQLRLAASVLAGVAVTLGGLPLLFLLVPETRTTRVAGLPLPWLLLGVLAYPVIVFLSRWYVHEAERIERDFSATVDLPSRDAG